MSLTSCSTSIPALRRTAPFAPDRSRLMTEYATYDYTVSGVSETHDGFTNDIMCPTLTRGLVATLGDTSSRATPD